ncbi:MAG TPA: biotin transporter BioY [Gemmatimonadales bacterium]|nr:biotin transporter BioY [Gemmatimonadales bacterium]
MQPTESRSFLAAAQLQAVGRRILVVITGAVVVALAAQVEVPLPFTPVPITLQPLAVLVVGGLLGASGGAAALVAYLAMGMMGLPVFAGGTGGAHRLLGLTGGYLLAFPVAALVAGRLTRTESAGALRVLLACVAGMVVIHVGGVAQLALLGGDPAMAFRLGFVPFLANDLIKIGLAAALLLVLRPRTRALR